MAWWHLHAAHVCLRLLLCCAAQCVREMGPTPSPNIRPLLAAAPPGTTLADIWVMGCSSSSMPQQQQQSVPRSHVAVLSDASGWMFHGGLGLWSCLRPGLHEPAGQAHRPGGFAAAAGNADAERLRCSLAAAAQAAGAAGLVPPQPRQGEGCWRARQAALELAAAHSLGDAPGYERWLGLLAHVLAQQREEVGKGRGAGWVSVCCGLVCLLAPPGRASCSCCACRCCLHCTASCCLCCPSAAAAAVCCWSRRG